jgi:hypothetical protein
LQALHRSALSCALALVLSPAPVLANAPDEPVRLCQTESPRYDYRLALTRLVLEKTARPGAPVSLERYGTGPDPSQERCLELLRSGDVDVVYLPPPRRASRTMRPCPRIFTAGVWATDSC